MAVVGLAVAVVIAVVSMGFPYRRHGVMVVALDTSTGKVRWSHVLLYPALAQPLKQPVAAVGGFGMVYAADSQGLWAYDGATGLPRWHSPGQAQISGLVITDIGVLSSAYRVVDSATRPATESTTIALHDPLTGTVRWRLSSPDLTMVGLSHKTVVVYDRAGGLRGITVAEGAVAWEAGVGSPEQATPLGSTMLIDTSTGVAAIDADTGNRRWMSSVVSSGKVMAVGDTVLVASDRGGLHGLSLATGSETWSSIGTNRQSVYQSMLAAPRAIYGVRFSHPQAGGITVTALDPGSGQPKWSSATDRSGAQTSLAQSSDQVIAASGNTVVAFAAGSGQQLWKARLHAPGSEPHATVTSAPGADTIVVVVDWGHPFHNET